jgi:hypothetical protein
MKKSTKLNNVTKKNGRSYLPKREKFRISLILVVLIVVLSGIAWVSQKTIREKKKIPLITKPVLFNTIQADEIIKMLQIFPVTSAYNEDISNRPVAPNSSAIIKGMSSRGVLGYNLDMGYVIVPPSQKKVGVRIYSYSSESDPGPFPIPDNAPIEGWSFSKGDDSLLVGGIYQSLDKIQRKGRGDRHVLVLDPYAKKLYEFYAGFKTDSGWRAAQATIFDLTSNKMRPLGWTSTDAAGLSVFAATVRYPDIEAGIVSHVVRVTARRTKREYVYPATHFASKLENADLPRMGERFRLKETVDISSFSPHAKAIARGMKKYGLIVADNGLDWLISIAPDDRFTGLDDLLKLKPDDFEVVVPTGPNDYGR